MISLTAQAKRAKAVSLRLADAWQLSGQRRRIDRRRRSGVAQQEVQREGASANSLAPTQRENVERHFPGMRRATRERSGLWRLAKRTRFRSAPGPAR